MDLIEQINNNSCSTKATLQGCANGVPYLLVVNDGCCDDNILKYINLNNGNIETVMPSGFEVGECAEAVCNKTYKDACADGVPYLVAVTDDCSGSSVAGLEFINLITGGKTTTAPTNIQYWSCDAVPTQSCVAYLETETFVATAGQTTFNISQVASGDVRISRNGATIADLAGAVSGTTVTYVPSENNNEPLLAGDRIEISYIYVDCEQIAKNFTDCIGNDLDANTALVTCAALNPDHFYIDPNSGEISSLCCDKEVQNCYKDCSSGQTTDYRTVEEWYNVNKSYTEVKNLTWVSGAEGDSQYTVRIVNGRYCLAMNLPIISGGNYQVLANPLLIYEKTQAGLPSGQQGFVQLDSLERAGTDKADLKFVATDPATGAILAQLDPGVETNSWQTRRLTFTIPASGSVKLSVYSQRSGSANGNDPCLDDFVVGYLVPVCISYKKVVSNGTTTWYDQNGGILNSTQIAAIEAGIAAGTITSTSCDSFGIDGSETKIVAGNGIKVQGNGTVSNPYIISLA